jgi:hypothetical protein
MLKAGVPKRGVQKSFEELVYSIVDKDSWRPTHISVGGINAYAEGNRRNLQRAHGVLSDRLGRYERTMKILEGDPVSFDVWWDFFIKHDKTVLITRKEHSTGKIFVESDLIQLPEWDNGMFENSGFSVRIRKKTEGVWLLEQHEKINIATKQSIL